MTTRRGPRLASVATGVVVVALYAPIALVVANSFNANERLTSWDGATMRWWVAALSDDRVATDIRTSLVVAGATVVVSVVLAVTDALWWRHASPRSRRILNAVVVARIVLPEIVLALALFLAVEKVDLPLGAAAIVVGQAVFCTAYATVLVQARLATLGSAFEDAAADLGAPPARVFTRITLPLLAPAVLTAALLVLTLSFDDVVIAQFLGGTEAETIPVLLLGKIRLTVSPEVNAIGTALMLVTALPIAAVLIWGRLPLFGRGAHEVDGDDR